MQITGPSSAYLAISRIPSFRTSTTPKLLVLDLNGTLLLRSKGYPRSIHLRPYMAAFRSFLFHETVKRWLEVRVWSSAQPQNVWHMVDRCFEDQRRALKAVWARDTLGLSVDDYSRKVKTTKDLEKQWSAHLSEYQYSAETTLLVDDSHLKAHLQPHNHICVPEYTNILRNKDLRSKVLEPVTKDKGIPAQQRSDKTLLAMIGILNEVRWQSNVAGWIRAGGLCAIQRPQSGEVSSSPELISNDHFPEDGPDTSRPQKESRSGESNEEVCGKSPPMWFDDPQCFQRWVEVGTQVAQSLGITLEHGIIGDGCS